MPSSLREEHKLLTRNRIIDASAEVFASLGYATATVDDIVSKARISRPTFYLHFSNKRDVYLEIAHSLLAMNAKALGTLDSILVSGSPDQFHDWMAAAVDYFDEQQAQIAIWSEASIVDRELAAVEARRAYEFVLESLPRYLASVPARDLAYVRLLVVTMISQIEAFFNLSRGRGAWDAERDLLVEVLADSWFTLLPHPAGKRKAASPRTSKTPRRQR